MAIWLMGATACWALAILSMWKATGPASIENLMHMADAIFIALLGVSAQIIAHVTEEERERKGRKP